MARKAFSIVVPKLPQDKIVELEAGFTEKKVGNDLILVSGVTKKVTRKIGALLAEIPDKDRPEVEEQIRYDSEVYQLARLEMLQNQIRKAAEHGSKIKKPWEQPFEKSETDSAGSATSSNDFQGDIGASIDPTSQTNTISGLHDYVLGYLESSTCPVTTREDRDAVLMKIVDLMQTAFPNSSGDTKVDRESAKYWIDRVPVIASKFAGVATPRRKENKNKKLRKEKV